MRRIEKVEEDLDNAMSDLADLKRRVQALEETLAKPKPRRTVK